MKNLRVVLETASDFWLTNPSRIHTSKPLVLSMEVAQKQLEILGVSAHKLNISTQGENTL